MTDGAAVMGIRTRGAACAATLIAAALLSAFAALVMSGPASAETGYRYWSYWYATGNSWTYATQGSGTRVPADGDVEGWRFGIAGKAADIEPSVPADFASTCATTPKPQTGKRVAVVIDPGSPSEAPEGQTPAMPTTACVVAASGATGYQILIDVASVRTDAGFVCGIDGYPASECAPLVDTESTTQEAPPSADDDTQVLARAPAEQGDPANRSSSVGTPLMTAAAISLFAFAGFGVWRHRAKARRS